MAKVGFIGLGVMGRPMAGHLLDAGHELSLYSRSGVPADLASRGRPCKSAKEVAENADVVITMVPDTPDVEAVLFAKDGVAEGLEPGKIVIDMSSISPVATKDFAKRIDALGCAYLDAPVSGGEVGAKQATLSIMCGGSSETFDKVRPLLEKLGKNITLVGDNGAGQTCKVANQIVVALTIEAVGEALLFASRAGADPAKVRQALMGGLATSRILELHGERMIKRTFDPGFRIELHQKDLNLALSSARALGVSLPNTASAQELFNACAAHGGAKWDHSAMVRALEIMANHEIGADAEDVEGDAAAQLGLAKEDAMDDPSARAFLRRLFDAAIAAADPAKLIPRHLPAEPKGRTIVVGAGKASAAMARAFEQHWTGELSGLVVTRYGQARPASASRSSKPRTRCRTREAKKPLAVSSNSSGVSPRRTWSSRSFPAAGRLC